MATITFPSDVIWAFNPNYIVIEDETEKTATVTVNGKTINVSLFNGKAEVYISRLVQIAFSNPANVRGLTINMSVTVGDYTDISTSFAMWGSIELGERFSQYGVYDYDESGKPYWERTVQWFKAYPFTIDLLLFPGVLRKRIDNLGYVKAKETENIELANFTINDDAKVICYRQDSEINLPTVSDKTFDHTFHSPGELSVLTRIVARNETDGFYLRWVDRFGFIQYYLFDKGDEKTKTDNANNALQGETTYGSTTFEYSRDLSFETTRSIEMCASNLDKVTFEYVRSIVSAVLVDMYFGKTKDGNEIWMPVRIDQNTYNAATSHKKILRDLTISVLLPQRNTQSL